MDNIVNLIHERVIPEPIPAVYISGGFDSSIVLYHLSLKCSNIHTYTADFGFGGSTVAASEKVAKWFGVKHKVVQITDFIDRLPEILVHFDRPRYNVWGYYLAEAAAKDGCKTAYIGEGGDENFGYSDRDYRTGWANHLAYVMPAYNYIHRAFNMGLEAPLASLPWKKFLLEYWHPEKKIVRDAYRKVLPEFIVDAPCAPPEFVQYPLLWKKYLAKYYPGFKPKDDNDIRYILQLIVAKIWLKVHSKLLRRF